MRGLSSGIEIDLKMASKGYCSEPKPALLRGAIFYETACSVFMAEVKELFSILLMKSQDD